MKKLRVVHIPQIGSGVSFEYEVPNELVAYHVMESMSLQHLHLYDNNIIPDYSNSIFVEIFEDGEWMSYMSEEGYDWEDYIEYVLNINKGDENK